MDIFIRGNVVAFTTTFYDSAGDPVTPASVSLTITTAPLGASSEVITMPMTGGPEWVAEWDTTGVSQGLVFWAAQATSPSGADEGDFFLEANVANA